MSRYTVTNTVEILSCFVLLPGIYMELGCQGCDTPLLWFYTSARQWDNVNSKGLGRKSSTHTRKWVKVVVFVFGVAWSCDCKLLVQERSGLYWRSHQTHQMDVLTPCFPHESFEFKGTCCIWLYWSKLQLTFAQMHKLLVVERVSSMSFFKITYCQIEELFYFYFKSKPTPLIPFCGVFSIYQVLVVKHSWTILPLSYV